MKILIAILILLISTTAYGADTKLEDMVEDTTPGTDSLLYTVDDPGGTAADRKVTISNFLEAFDYAGGVDSGGASLSGDSATSFFAAGEIEVVRGGTGAASLTDGGIMLGSGTGAVTVLAVAANGEIPIGDGATDPVLATITATANETDVTNGAGSITIGIVASPTLDGTNFTGIPVTGLTGVLPVANGGTGDAVGYDVVSADVGDLKVTQGVISRDVGDLKTKTDIISSDIATLTISNDIISTDVGVLYTNQGIISRDVGDLKVKTDIISSDVAILYISNDIISTDIGVLKFNQDVISSDVGDLKTTQSVISSDVGDLKTKTTIISTDINNYSGPLTIVSNDVGDLKQYLLSATILSPDIVNSANGVGIPIMTIPSEKFPSGVIVSKLGIRTNKSVTTKVMMEAWTFADPAVYDSNLDELSISAGTLSTDTTLSNDVVSADFIIFADLDTTQIEWLKVWALFTAK